MAPNHRLPSFLRLSAAEAPYITGNGTAAAAAAGTSGEFLIRKSSIPLSRLSSSASVSVEGGVQDCVIISDTFLPFPSTDHPYAGPVEQGRYLARYI